MALVAALVVALAEALHARRVRRVARLAFGPVGRPARWVVAAPFLRCVGAAATAAGAAVLAAYDPIETDVPPAPRASRQLLVCLDVSPSMHVVDAGPDAQKVSRTRWAGELVGTILDRLDMKDTRITLVGFYGKALPILVDTTDRHVVANLFDGLRLDVAFEPGRTDLSAGVRLAFELAKPWAPRSATLVVITDGDAERAAIPSVPSSIADTIVIGVGDPLRATVVSGHSSRQDEWSLKDLASRLGGHYHQGNRLHLPTAVLDGLTMLRPNASRSIGERTAGLVLLAVGCGLLGLLGPALALAGRGRAPVIDAPARSPS